MAIFSEHIDYIIANEGGYKLTDIQHDRGGQTYAGISRKSWPRWEGWMYVDSDRIPPKPLVDEFYLEEFWNPLQLDKVDSFSVARNIFDFAVNSGTSTAIRLAQSALGIESDGKIGPKTLKALNDLDESDFLIRYALAKIARYVHIVDRDRSQGKFLLGWLHRTLKGT